MAEVDIQQGSLISPAQERIMDQIADFFSGRIGQTATPYEGERVAPLPQEFFDAIDAFGVSQGFQAGDIQKALRSRLDSNMATPDLERVTREHREFFADPLLDVFESTTGTANKEKFAGGLYATREPLVTGRLRNEFTSSAITPQLGIDLQNERLRAERAGQFNAMIPGMIQDIDVRTLATNLQIAGIMQAQRQAQDDAEWEEFLRLTDEESPWLKLPIAFATATTRENIATVTGGMGGGGEGIGSILGGAGAAAMGLAALSDERRKENLTPINNALDKVEELIGHTYNYSENSADNKDAGVIAQDVQRVLPEAVIEKDGLLYVKYEGVVALLVNAVNELRERIDDGNSN